MAEIFRNSNSAIQIAAIQKGGARLVDLKSLKAHVNKGRQAGAIGIEAQKSSRVG
jgi:predicted transcriptional regulator